MLDKIFRFFGYQNIMKPVTVDYFKCEKDLKKYKDAKPTEGIVEVAKGIFICGNRDVKVTLLFGGEGTGELLYHAGFKTKHCELDMANCNEDDILDDFQMMAWEYFARKYYRMPYEMLGQDGMPYIIDPSKTLSQKPVRC